MKVLKGWAQSRFTYLCTPRRWVLGIAFVFATFFLLPNYSEFKASLLQSQMLAALRLEKNLTEEKINVQILCARDVLLSQLQRSKITKFQYRDAIGRFLRALGDEADSMHRDLELKQNELRKVARELSPLLEIESLKQYSAYLVRLNLATENLDEVFKRSVSSLPHLTPTEVNGITERFLDQSVKLDSGLNIKRFQQMNVRFKFCQL